MAKNFTETSIEYNWGFIDGLLWVLNSGNRAGLDEIVSKVKEIRKANDDMMNEEEKRFEQLRINFEKTE